MALMPVDEAKALVLAGVKPKGIEKVALNEAFGRVLAVDLHARHHQPPFTASAMDGYAINSKDVSAGSQFRLIGTAAGGHPFRGTVEKGQAVRIFTGAMCSMFSPRWWRRRQSAPGSSGPSVRRDE